MNSIHTLIPPTSFKKLENLIEKQKGLYLQMVKLMEDEKLIVPADDVNFLPPQEILYKLLAIPDCKKFYAYPLIYTIGQAYENYLNGDTSLKNFSAFLEIPLTNFKKNVKKVDEGYMISTKYGKLYYKPKVNGLHASSRLFVFKDGYGIWRLYVKNPKLQGKVKLS